MTTTRQKEPMTTHALGHRIGRLLIMGGLPLTLSCAASPADDQPCFDGATQPCLCGDGDKGTQTCDAGIFGVCVCTPSSSDGSALDGAPLDVVDDVAAQDSGQAPADGGVVPKDAGLNLDGGDSKTCKSDKDCKAESKVCDPLTNMCVACLTDDECAESEHCVALACQTYTSCTNSLGCKSAAGPDSKAQPICDPSIGECTACLTEADCEANQDCKGKSCVPYKTCQNSTDCSADRVCDKASKRCVACLNDNDCSASELCDAGECRAFVACSSDKQCTPLGQLCDTDKGKCAQCLEHTDCPETYHCQNAGVAKTGMCLLDVCAQSQGA